MLTSLINKEFKLLFSDLHGLAVLFIMPTLFLLIMSLAIPSESELNKPYFEIHVVDEIQNENSQFFQQLLLESGYILSVTKANNPTLSSPNQVLLVINESFQDYALGENTESVSLQLELSPKLDGQFKSTLISALSVSASKARLKNILIDLELINSDTPQEELINEVNQAAPIAKIEVIKSDMGKIPNAVEQSMPAWIIFGMFFIVMPLSNTLIKEKNSNTLARIKSFDVSAYNILLHKLIPYAVINQFQFGFLLLVAIYLVPALGGEQVIISNSFLLYALMSVATSIAALGLGLFIAILCKTTEQAIVLGGGTNLILAAIGGIMIPQHIMSDSIQWLTQLSPMNWALNGFQQILLFPSSISDITPYLLLLTASGSILLFISLALFRVQYRKLSWN